MEIESIFQHCNNKVPCGAWAKLRLKICASNTKEADVLAGLDALEVCRLVIIVKEKSLELIHVRIRIRAELTCVQTE